MRGSATTRPDRPPDNPVPVIPVTPVAGTGLRRAAFEGQDQPR